MIYRENYWFISKTIDFCENFTESKMTRITFYTYALSSIIKILVFWPRKMAKLFKPLNSYKMKTRNTFIIFLVNDSQTPPPPPFKNENLGLLQIRILHLRKHREKSFPTVKMFLVLKLRGFKVANLPFMDLVVFWGREQKSLLLKIAR